MAKQIKIPKMSSCNYFSRLCRFPFPVLSKSLPGGAGLPPALGEMGSFPTNKPRDSVFLLAIELKGKQHCLMVEEDE